MKRILIFSLAYYPHVGGAEVALKELTDRMPDIEWHMLTMQFGGSPHVERVGNVHVYRIGPPAGGGGSYLSKILFILRAAKAARALHRTHPFDALWAMMTYMIFPVVFANLRIPYILSLQDGDPFERVFRRWYILPFLPLLRRGFRKASAVTALSTYLAAWAKKMGYQGAVAIIPNGADLARFTPHANSIETSGVVNLVTSSRLVHKNALDDVIRALVLLPKNIHFIIYGSGKEEQSLKELARTLKVSERVLFRGYVPHAELARAFATAHIFIRPSRTEGFGASFVEAMAAGLPVIATQEGGVADFLFDEKRNPDKPTTGWAVDPDAPEQIADAVKDIMTNPDKVARVRDSALALVREKYDWDIIAKQMHAQFEAVFTHAHNTLTK